jgi:hypothetical protein
LAAALFFAAVPAQAIVPIWEGSPHGTATDLLKVTGVYAPPLPGAGAQPFASPDFTLSIIMPAQVDVSAAGPVLSEFFIPVSGSYTNNGQTETFVDQLAFFGATNTGLPTFPNNFSIQINGLLTPTDFFDVSFQADQALFNPTIFVAGTPETMTVGNLSIVDASASYATDPPFTGVISITRLPASVPEPSAWLMVLVGTCGVGAAVRRRQAGLAVAA